MNPEQGVYASVWAETIGVLIQSATSLAAPQWPPDYSAEEMYW